MRNVRAGVALLKHEIIATLQELVVTGGEEIDRIPAERVDNLIHSYQIGVANIALGVDDIAHKTDVKQFTKQFTTQ